MVIDEAELNELEELGVRLAKAFELSGEPPSLAAIELAQASLAVPERTASDIAKFNEAVRYRIELSLRDATGAESLGAWVQQVREAISVDEAAAAGETGVALSAYRQFEAGRVPVWRMPAELFAAFCRRMSLDTTTLLAWISVITIGSRRGVYGRLDLEDDERSGLLDALALESEIKSETEFDAWRRAFMSAYDQPSGGDAH